MDNLTIAIDFTGHSAPTSLVVLPEGYYLGSIDGFSHYEESNRLYVYIDAFDGEGETVGRVRESFNLTGKGVDFLMAFLHATGVNMAKLKGSVNFPFHTLKGKKIGFRYTPPTLDAAGDAVQGSYANFRFYTPKQTAKLMGIAEVPVAEDFEVVAKEDAVEAKTVSSNSDDASWLMSN